MITKGMVLVILILSATAKASTVVHFSPNGGCEQEIVHLIDDCKKQLDIAVYSLNNTAILKALDGAKGRGVKIRILTDHIQAAVNATSTVTLSKKGFDLKLHSIGRIMHNKYAIFDNKKLITGSFNWTNSAEKVNEENCLLLDDIETISKYDQQFSDHLWVVNTFEKSKKYLSKIIKKATKKVNAQENSHE